MASNPRIFRCPNCGNTITEQHSVSVYQCSDCFATLQAVHRRKECAVDRLGLEADRQGDSWEFRKKDNPVSNFAIYSIAGSNFGSSRGSTHDLRLRASQTPERLFGSSTKVNDGENQGTRNGGAGGFSPVRFTIEQKQEVDFGENWGTEIEVEGNNTKNSELGQGSVVDKRGKYAENRRQFKGDVDSTTALTGIQSDRRSETFRGLHANQMDRKMDGYAEGRSSCFSLKPTHASKEDQNDSILNMDPMQLLKELDELRDYLIKSSPICKRAPSPTYHHSQDATRFTKGLPLVDAIAAQSPLPRGQYVGISNFSSQTPGRRNSGGYGELRMLQAVEAPHIVSTAGNYPTVDPSEHETYNYNRRVANFSSNSEKLSPQERVNRLPDGDKHHCPLIAGAAPFVLCWSCFELLRVPEKTSVVANKQRKIRCGSCSEILLLDYDGKRLVTSTSLTRTSNEEHNISDFEASSRLHSQGRRNAKRINSDGDHDVSNSSVHSLVQNVVSPPTSRHGMIFNETPPKLSDSENMNVISKPDNRPKGFECTDGRGARRGSMELLSDDDSISEGKQSCTEVEEMPTEIGLVAGDSPKSSTSQDPFYYMNQDGIEDYHESYSASPTTKKSHKVHLFHHSRKGNSSKVSVNGHPISDRLVKKAEKKAGPILPGEYWYDRRSGFWGVMGQQCLGIIPPFIEEFNYPLAKDCAGGNTGIFVNGRELHERDLNLLVSRGLPPATGQSYTLDIHGKLFDAFSGEKLPAIQKLAPTVEKLKRGFGMQAPRH